ncbi:hypothetical protein L211DRAFT_870730 [Terfezia boudieri ATCC MYA-4762]|uniref:Uncharacterized protein n=1 Tax=Terfezia boudieri ATCC MYA-4762 TaxID=1051890 RepID=A0A3N4LFS2_9PEZI|nr:hypothetical protein L211DRAFT_870730 [Terfezia boudieri ATCC MYA-4762]
MQVIIPPNEEFGPNAAVPPASESMHFSSPIHEHSSTTATQNSATMSTTLGERSNAAPPQTPATISTSLHGVIGSKTISEYFTEFDFSKIQPKNKYNEDHLNVDYAPSYGPRRSSLGIDVFKSLDESGKILLLAVLKSLKKLGPGGRKWDNLISELTQNQFLVAKEEPISNSNSLVRKVHRTGFKRGVTDTDHFDTQREIKVDNGGFENGPEQVRQFYHSLVNHDRDIIDSTMIHPDIYVHIAALIQELLNNNNFLAWLYKDVSYSKKLIDITVLRFPDIEGSSIKIYRIELNIIASSTLTLGAGTEQYGLLGSFESRTYVPRQKTINNLPEAIKKDALKHLAGMVGAVANESG